MSLLDAYTGLMESVTWKQRTGIDQYGDPSYTDSTISVIWFDDEKLIRNAEDEEFRPGAGQSSLESITAARILRRYTGVESR